MKKLVLQNQEIEEEGTRMEATAHGDVKVRLTHMCDWDDGIGPSECQVGQLWRSRLPLHLCLLRMRSPSKASHTQHWGLFLLAWIWPPLVKSRRKLQLRKLCSIKVHHSGLLENYNMHLLSKILTLLTCTSTLDIFPREEPEKCFTLMKEFCQSAFALLRN